MSRLRNKDDAAVDQALATCREDLKLRFPLPSPPPARKPRQSTKAVSLLVLALVAGAVWQNPAYRNEHYVTQVGQRQSVQLADGSQIKLDGGSEVRVSWHLRSRNIELVRGQALFAVSPMLYRPFLVDAGTAAIRVVGTRFNVNRYSDDVRVTVAQGQVEVKGRALDRTSQLLAGQQLFVHNGIPLTWSRAVSKTRLHGSKADGCSKAHHWLRSLPHCNVTTPSRSSWWGLK